MIIVDKFKNSLCLIITIETFYRFHREKAENENEIKRD